MNVTDRAGVPGTNVVGILSRAYDRVVEVLTAIEEVGVAHKRFHKLVAAGVDPAAAAAKVLDQTAGRAPVTQPSTREPVTPRQSEMRLAA